MTGVVVGAEDRPTVLERVVGHCGELVLRRAGIHFEVIANGTFLMDTRNGESERLLVTEAARRMPGPRMLIGGLGVGFSLNAALGCAEVGAVTVIEREAAVIRWNRGPLHTVSQGALDDPRVRCVRAGLLAWLRSAGDLFDALCLDIDNGPRWTINDDNRDVYTGAGLDLLAGRLTARGVLAVWSAAVDGGFATALRKRFDHVEVLRVSVPRGEPDVVYLARKPWDKGQPDGGSPEH